jgi:hypothetical protein
MQQIMYVDTYYLLTLPEGRAGTKWQPSELKFPVSLVQ